MKLPLFTVLALLTTSIILTSTNACAQIDEVLVTGIRGDGATGLFGLMREGNPAVFQGQTKANADKAGEATDKAKQKPDDKCKDKASKIAAIDAKSSQCKVDAKTTFAKNANNCTSVTKATISIGAQGNVSGDISKDLKAFDIKVGALIGGNASGTLEWNPNADCRLKLADTLDATLSQCDATASKDKVELASCP